MDRTRRPAITVGSIAFSNISRINRHFINCQFVRRMHNIQLSIC